MPDSRYDVFVSYATADRQDAEAIYHHLESLGLRCFVAHKSIMPGAKWQTAVTEALLSSSALVLIVSHASNDSSNVHDEVLLANQSGLHIIQFKRQHVDLHPELKLPLSRKHWLDATTPPLTGHLEKLEAAISRLLRQPDIASVVRQASENGASWKAGSELTKSRLLPKLLVVAGTLALAFAVWKSDSWRSTAESVPRAELVDPTLHLFKSDAVTSLESSSTPARRITGGSSAGAPALENGVEFEFLVSNTGASMSKPGSIELRFAASEAEGFVIDPTSAGIVSTGRQMSALKTFANGGQYTHSAAINMVTIPRETPSASDKTSILLFVGKHGTLPAGPLPVQAAFFAEPDAKGGALGKVDFFVNVEPADWAMGAETPKIALFHADGTTPIDAGVIIASRNCPKADVNTVSENQMFAIPLTATGAIEASDLPATIRLYALKARFANEAAKDGSELVVDAAEPKRDRLPQGELILLASSQLTLPLGAVQSTPLKLWSLLGARGELPAGEHPLGVMVTRGQEVLFRSKATVKITHDWPLPEGETKLNVMDADFVPLIPGTVLQASRVPPMTIPGPTDQPPVTLTEGVKFALRLQCKNEPLPGPLSVSFYLKAESAASVSHSPSSIKTALQLFQKPIAQGYTTVCNWSLGYPQGIGSGIVVDLPEVKFYVGNDQTQRGEIPAGVHDLGIEILSGPLNSALAVYRGEVKLNVAP